MAEMQDYYYYYYFFLLLNIYYYTHSITDRTSGASLATVAMQCP